MEMRTSTSNLQGRRVLAALIFLQAMAATNCGGGGTAAPPPPVISVSVSPQNVTLLTGATQQFTATVVGSANQGVTWAVSCASGGSACGAINPSSGLYTAPSVPPSPDTVTVIATSAVIPSGTGSATVTVNNPQPSLSSISPNAATVGDGDTALTIAGSGFASQSVVYANATALATTFSSPTQLVATIPAALLSSAGTMTITVATPAPGGGVSSGLPFDVWPGYPRTNAGSVLTGPPPALKQIPLTGTKFSVLDWTSKDDEGQPIDVLATDHVITEMGIPNIDTTDLATAVANPFLAVAGVLNEPWALSSTEIAALISYVKGGGTLYLWEPSVTSLLTALGISGETDYSGTAQRPLTFDVSQPDPILKYIDDPAEVNWGPYFPPADVTRGYSAGSCTPLATWNASGDFALLRCDLGAGRAYVFGWRLRPLIALPELREGNATGPQGVNYIVPDADICRLLMRGSYEGFASNPQEREWAPGGHHAALIITHDVDATVSYQNVPAWVDFEDSLGIKSTFLFTTLPYDSGYIAAMYTASGHEDILYALEHGFDVESEGFGHFPDFASAPYSLTNPPSETAANYMPKFTPTPPGSQTCCTSGMSVVGEVGVSKWLLDNDFNIQVNSIRSGFTLVPPNFLEGLAATGYSRDLSYLLDLTRGSFPFVTFSLNTSTTPPTVVT